MHHVHCLAGACIYKSITRNLKFIPTSAVCLYAIRYVDIPLLTPSFPLSTPWPTDPEATHQPSFLFISAKFPPHQAHPRNPHTSPASSLSPTPAHTGVSHLPSRSSSRYWHQLPSTHSLPTFPRYLLRSAAAVMAAVTESIKVVLMRLNCRRYCRPPPPLNPLVPIFPPSFATFP